MSISRRPPSDFTPAHRAALSAAVLRAYAEDPTYSERLRAAMRGRVVSPEHRAKIAATLRGRAPGEAARRGASMRHRGVPKSETQRSRTSAALLGHAVSPETRAKISATLAGRRPSPERLAKQRAGLERWRSTGTRAWRSQLECRAAPLLPGFQPQIRIGGHAFDYASPDRRILVEVNGCYWHDHRSSDSTCPLPGRRQPIHQDERTRATAARVGAVLVELWECQEARWPQQLAAQLR